MVSLPEFHTSFHLREDRNPSYVLTDAMEIHIIDISKFRRLREVDFGNQLHRWLTFLDRFASRETLEEVFRMDQSIQKVNERMDFVLQDKESLRRYLMRELELSDITSGLKLARAEGHAEGHAEGRGEGLEEGLGKGLEKGLLLAAKNALIEGAECSFVAKFTGLDIAVVNKLRAEL
jgi:predicted transposase/invertase (TIGR01784 family)